MELMLIGAGIAILCMAIGYFTARHSREFKAYEDMKGFANAYSELAIGMFNAKNNQVVPSMDHGQQDPVIDDQEEPEPDYASIGGTL